MLKTAVIIDTFWHQSVTCDKIMKGMEERAVNIPVQLIPSSERSPRVLHSAHMGNACVPEVFLHSEQQPGARNNSGLIKAPRRRQQKQILTSPGSVITTPRLSLSLLQPGAFESRNDEERSDADKVHNSPQLNRLRTVPTKLAGWFKCCGTANQDQF